MQPVPASRATAVLQATILAVVVAAAVLLAWHPLEDLDIWFHHRAGSDLLAQGPLPPYNNYSFSEPRHPWLNHEWLFQLLTRACGPRAPLTAGDVGGWNLLRAALACALALVLALGDGGWRRLRGHGPASAAGGVGLLLLAAFGLLWPRLLLRPELLSYIALVLLVRWTEALHREIGREGTGAVRPRNFLDPRTAAGRVWWLVWLWAQGHGFSAAAPLLVGLGLLGFPPEHPRRRPAGPQWRAAGAAFVATMVALAATPNGWQGLSFPLRALGQFGGEEADLRRTVAELAPLLRSPNSLHGTILLFKASLVAGVVMAVLGWRRLGALRLFLWAATAGAALVSQRALGPYAVAFALLGLRAGLPERWRGQRAFTAGTPWATPMAIGTTLAAAFAAAAWAYGIVSDRFYLSEGVGRRFGAGLATAHYPVAAAAALAQGPPVRVFANLGASGLLLATTGAAVFIDGRTEAYSPGLWREYLEIRRGGEHALALLDARRVEAVCLASPAGVFGALAADLLASHRWQLVAADGAGLLFRRESLTPGPDAAPLQAALKRERLLLAAHTQRQNATAAGLSPARTADALLAASTLYRLANDAEGRRTCLERALQLMPRHPLAQHNLGTALLAENRFELALTHFRAAAAGNGRLAGSRLNAGVCLMRLDRPGEAIGWFRQAVRLNANQFEAWANLALALKATGDRAGALVAVERALTLSPANAQLTGLRDSLRRPGPPQ